MKLKYFIVGGLITGLSACGAKSTSGDPVQTVKPVAASAAPNADAGPPNIVIMLADDLGYADLSFRGSDIDTPHIDSLARDGMNLERFYVLPICTPTRSALMTARDPMKLGTAYAGYQPWHNGGVSPTERFLPQTFQAAGYQTAMIGKWHLGFTHEALTPNARGFDHFFGHLNTQIDYFDYTVSDGYDLQENGISQPKPDAYATDIHGEQAARYLTDIRDPEKPFLLYVPFLAPHTPMQAPEALEDKYKNRRNTPVPKRTYAAMVDSLDQAVGRVLTTLEEQGLSGNTIVFFFSDNGGITTFGSDNSPFRGGKLQTFEGGVRVTGLLRYPGHIAPGSSYPGVVSVMDLYPTFAAAAGVEMDAEKKLDGQNLWPKISSGDVSGRKGDLYFGSNSPLFNRYHVSVMEEKWKLVQIIEHHHSSTDVETFLFDIVADPSEESNLAEDNPAVVKRMAAKIEKWRSQYPINGVRVGLMPDPGWRAPNDYADIIIPSDKVQEGYHEGYVKGLRGNLLQRMHGDKGRLKYE